MVDGIRSLLCASLYNIYNKPKNALNFDGLITRVLKKKGEQTWIFIFVLWNFTCVLGRGNGTYGELGDDSVVSCVCLAGTSSGAPAWAHSGRAHSQLRLSGTRGACRAKVTCMRGATTAAAHACARGRPTTNRVVHLVSAASKTHLWSRCGGRSPSYCRTSPSRRRPASSRAPLVGRCL